MDGAERKGALIARSAIFRQHAGMKRFFLLGLAPFLLAAPAKATGGLVCTTASGTPTSLSFVIGHHGASSIVQAQLKSGDKDWLPVQMSQAWLGEGELRVDIADMETLTRTHRIVATLKGDVFDGTIEDQEGKRWIRCREG